MPNSIPSFVLNIRTPHPGIYPAVNTLSVSVHSTIFLSLTNRGNAATARLAGFEMPLLFIIVSEELHRRITLQLSVPTVRRLSQIDRPDVKFAPDSVQSV